MTSIAQQTCQNSRMYNAKTTEVSVQCSGNKKLILKEPVECEDIDEQQTK
jgi:hypothetical protein